MRKGVLIFLNQYTLSNFVIQWIIPLFRIFFCYFSSISSCVLFHFLNFVPGTVTSWTLPSVIRYFFLCVLAHHLWTVRWYTMEEVFILFSFVKLSIAHRPTFVNTFFWIFSYFYISSDNTRIFSIFCQFSVFYQSFMPSGRDFLP